jgi:lysylphosphatidylglycerol synthetase-like protein (DUF2156 family)
MMNYIQILVRTAHCGIHLNVTNSDCCLHTSERLLAVKEFTWMTVSNSKLLFSPRVQGLLVSGDCYCILRYVMSASCLPCVLRISQLDYYCLCPLLTVFLFATWRFLETLNEGFLKRTSIVLWWKARTRDVTTTLTRHSNVYGWLRTAL